MAGGDGGLLRGRRFRLLGFDDEKEDDEYRRLITNEGGLFERTYIWQDLYLITSTQRITYADPTCVVARKNGAIVLNQFWLDDTFATRVLPDTKKVIYRPPPSLDGIKGAARLIIAQSGFMHHESFEIKRLIAMSGAYEAQEDKVGTCSYLICNKPEGKDYETANAEGVFTVNKAWIEDCVMAWAIVSVDTYMTWPPSKAQTSRSRKTPRKETDSTMGRIGFSTERKANTKLIESRKRISESRINFKRQAVSKAPSCRRVLFPKSLSEYIGRNLILRVHIPRSQLQIDIGTNDVKSFLLGSFEALVNIHLEGQCIMNELSSSSYHRSEDSEQVRIQPVQLVPFNQELAASNRSDFIRMVQKMFKDNGLPVPGDIAGWLSEIAANVPEKVLKRHVNMLKPNEVFAAFMAMYYVILRLKRRKSLTDYNTVVGSEGFDDYIDWELTPFRWIVLKESLMYIHPSQLEVYRLQCQQSCGQPVHRPEPKARDSRVFGLLEVIRDCFFHPALDYQEMLLPVMLAEYPHLLADLQRVLSSLGLLD